MTVEFALHNLMVRYLPQYEIYDLKYLKFVYLIHKKYETTVNIALRNVCTQKNSETSGEVLIRLLHLIFPVDLQRN